MTTTWCLATRHNNQCDIAVIAAVFPVSWVNTYRSPFVRVCVTGSVANLYAIYKSGAVPHVSTGISTIRQADTKCFRLSQRRYSAGITLSVVVDGLLHRSHGYLRAKLYSAFFGTLPLLMNPETYALPGKGYLDYAVDHNRALSQPGYTVRDI